MTRMVTFEDVLAAKDRIAAWLPPTPMWHYPALDAVARATVFVKHENMQPVGAFKVRGGLNLVSSLSPAERERGLVTASTGNHAQSIAYAARQFGAPCEVFMPTNANAAKVRATQALGATVTLTGADVTEAFDAAAARAGHTGARLVSLGDEPLLIAGVATLYAEILTAEPDLDAILVPIGSGTGASGACLAAAALSPDTKIIGVQSAAAPAAHDSWRAGEVLHRPNRTAIEGVATSRAYELPQSILTANLDDFVLLPDEVFRAAQRLLASHAHTLAEGAGAAGLGAVLAGDRFAGQRVAVVCTGGNASPTEVAGLGGPAVG
jgi:threonine dehydratase